MSYLALQTNQNILYPWKQIFPLKDNKRYWLWVEIPIIEFRAYFHQTHVHTLEGTCVWISWGNILLLTLYDPICIIHKWKKLLNLITSLLLLGYSIGIFIRSCSILVFGSSYKICHINLCIWSKFNIDYITIL